MSRRFGRQQKRRLLQEIEWQREDIQQVVQMLRSAESMLDASRKERDRYERIVIDTADLLGKYFITLNPTVIELKSLTDLGDYWTVVNQRVTPVSAAHAAEYVEEVIEHIQRLPVLRCRAILDDLEKLVHFRFTFNGKDAGYAISHSYFSKKQHHLPVVRRNVALAVGRLLVDTEVQS
ncbi:MAG: hypothetical protein Q8N34_03395 [Gammaproteobacteria bacterium]|nr:hypothetical protein [Gammaproteobacteria bacterium]